MVSPYLTLTEFTPNERAGELFPEHVRVMSREHVQAKEGERQHSIYMISSPLRSGGDMLLCMYVHLLYCSVASSVPLKDMCIEA